MSGFTVSGTLELLCVILKFPLFSLFVSQFRNVLLNLPLLRRCPLLLLPLKKSD